MIDRIVGKFESWVKISLNTVINRMSSGDDEKSSMHSIPTPMYPEEVDPAREPSQVHLMHTPTTIYIVYSYVPCLGAMQLCKRIKGIYATPEEAMRRQVQLIPNGEFGVNGSRTGRALNNRSMTTFVNTYDFGNTDTEIHTTSIPNWQRYAMEISEGNQGDVPVADIV